MYTDAHSRPQQHTGSTVVGDTLTKDVSAHRHLVKKPELMVRQGHDEGRGAAHLLRVDATRQLYSAPF